MAMSLDEKPVRQANGQFVAGQSGNPSGRPHKRTLDQALREVSDYDELAALIMQMARSPGRDQQRAIEYWANRLAGAPRQMLTLEADADSPAVMLMRQIWSRLGGVEDSTTQSPAVDAAYRELPAGSPAQATSQPATDGNKVDNDASNAGGP